MFFAVMLRMKAACLKNTGLKNTGLKNMVTDDGTCHQPAGEPQCFGTRSHHPLSTSTEAEPTSATAQFVQIVDVFSEIVSHP